MSGLRVAIVNVPPDHNKGACAIAWGLINRLRATGMVERITLFSTLSSFEQVVDYRHLTARFPDIEIRPAPVKDFRGKRERGVRTIVGAVRQGAYLLREGISLAFSEGASTKRWRMSDFGSADLVLDRGGPFFEALGPPPNFTLLIHAWPFLAAHRLGIPYALVGETLGRVANPWARRVLKGVLDNAQIVGVRERFSLDRARDLDVRSKVVQMLDNAFWVETRESDAAREVVERTSVEEGRFLTVTCRPWHGATTRYLSELAHAVDSLIPATFQRALVVANCLNPSGADPDDRAVGRALVELVGDESKATTVDDDLAPDELAWLYGRSGMVLGTRLHSLILGLVGGAPVTGISYYGAKSRGVLESVNLGDSLVEFERFTGRELARIVEAAAESQHLVAGRLESLRAEGDAGLYSLIQHLNTGAVG